MADQTVSTLFQELHGWEGITGQDPETGARSEGTDIPSFLPKYTTRLFGCPFQLADSVDKRFGDINANVGNEFLRNFILNSPILYVKPGLPKYTGGINEQGLMQSLKGAYMDTTLGGMNAVQSFMGIMSSKFFSKGSTMTRRMYGFRETYYDYMQHVNYMLHAIAQLMNLTSDTSVTKQPNAVLTSEGTQLLKNVKWENYRMMGSTVKSPLDQLVSMTVGVAENHINNLIGGVGNVITGMSGSVKSVTGGAEGYAKMRQSMNQTNLADLGFGSSTSFVDDSVDQAVNNFLQSDPPSSMAGVLSNKISTVQFMVEPDGVTESYDNQTQKSVLASAADAPNELGREIAWMSQSKVADNAITTALDTMGSGLESVMNLAGQLSSPLDGGFVMNLLTGALNSLKGQKMLYPEIYAESSASQQHSYTINLESPYGDPYNYFMNILVPYVHLLCLMAPRMVTSNSISSPYLVQCYIPGMSTCQLGIITNMEVKKNPNGNHVSVHGYPLSMKVVITVKDLYQNISIGAANDPGSFLFNESLNDYMCNMAGLIPSIDTYSQQRAVSFGEMNQYIQGGLFAQDMAANALERIENKVNPFVGR